ncbi:hypothetical protein ABLE93_14865 [Xanthobacter sp. KR7-65]|uniref:hypothetical protein n=1 Tax=Xanthobacter sp. KR7-65 TaxID=3156612 RepID=UPI0032B53E77
MAPIKVELQEAALAPVSDGRGEAMPPSRSEASSAASLSGAWVPLPEAIAWIIFRDFGKARALREASPSRMALEYHFAQAGIDLVPPTVSVETALDSLLDTLRSAEIVARHRSDGQKIDDLDPIKWVYMKFTEDREGWRVEFSKVGIFRDITLNAGMLLQAFPKVPDPVEHSDTSESDAPEESDCSTYEPDIRDKEDTTGSLKEDTTQSPDETNDSETDFRSNSIIHDLPFVGTGAPGRPTSRHLVRSEMHQRHMRGEMFLKLSYEAKYLEGWLEKIPNAHPMTARTIENALRAEFRKLKDGQPTKI